MGLFVTGCYTVMIVLSNKWLKSHSNLEPSGFDFNILTDYELFRRKFGSKIVIVVEQTQIAVIWSCKACLLIMYHRLTRTALRNENIAIKLLSAYVALGFVVIEILYFAAWCRPFSEYYAVPTASSQCNGLVHHRITKAVFNISSDIIMLLIALQMLIRSLLPMKRKLILCGIFSLGIFVVAASIMNSYYSFKNPYRATWIYWYVRESSTAILVANLPFTWTILRKFFELSDFDESHPPPWTYHSSRTAGGRKTAQLLHQTNTTGAPTMTKRSPNNSNGSGGTQSMTMVGSMSTTKQLSNSPAKSLTLEDTDYELQDEYIQPHDFAPVSSSYADDRLDIDLEQGHLDAVHLRPVSPDHATQRDYLMASPPRITHDGTGGYCINGSPISPPSRAQLAASSNRSREPSLSSVNRRPLSPASSHPSSITEGTGRRGSAASVGANVGHAVGGGRSARDRRARTKMSG